MKYTSFGLWDPNIDPDLILANTKTRVHPLNNEMVTSSRLDSTGDEECGNEFVFA